MPSSLITAALWNQAGHYIFALWFLLSSIFLSFSLAYSQPSQIECLPYFHAWCGLSANLGCRSETCCMWLAEIQDTKITQKSPSGHHPTTLPGYIFTTKANIDNRKKPIKQQYLLHMFPQYGKLWPISGAAELSPVVWGTPANFNGFHILAALLHGILVVGVRQTLRR